jgi:hypothetical protein
MTNKAELSLEQADDFEEKVRLAFDASEKIGHLELANAYRQLAEFQPSF